MNYISQLTAAIDKLTLDKDLNPAHVSLYLALFYLWNTNRFRNPISVNRSEVMEVSKIGSKTTYHKCLKELDSRGFIVYHPSHNPMKGSLINMTIFGTTTGTTTGTTSGTSTGQVVGQVLVPSLNNININKLYKPIIKNVAKNKIAKAISPTQKSKESKIIFSIPSLEEIKTYFFEKQMPESEADKFFNYFESNGWLVGGKAKMKNWKAAARNWMLNASKFRQQMPGDSLRANTNKSYDIPL